MRDIREIVASAYGMKAGGPGSGHRCEWCGERKGKKTRLRIKGIHWRLCEDCARTVKMSPPSGTVKAVAYKLQGKTKFQGLPISIENKKGSIRKGVGADGKTWKVRMPFDYGYIGRTQGTDKDHIDCFIGPNASADKVYVIHQNKENSKSYDEDKVMLGFDSADQALTAYKSAYTGVDLFRSMSVLGMDEFKKKICRSKDLKKPHKIHAFVGYDGDYFQYNEKIGSEINPPAHPPSLKKPKKVKVNNPDESDEQYKSKKMKKRLRKDIAERTRTGAGKPEIVQTTLFVPINQG